MEETKKCPACAETIKAEAKKCPKCQKDLRNWFVRHWIISSLLFIFVWIPFISGILYNPNIEENNQNNVYDEIDSNNEIDWTSDTINKIKWHYYDTEDEMDGTKDYFASLTSDNTIDLSYPYTWGNARIVIRKNGNNKLDIMFIIDSWIILDYNNTARIKFDDEQPMNVNIYWTSDWSSDVVFLWKEQHILSKLKKSKKVMIEVEFHEDGRKVAKFSTEWLKWDK